MFKLVYTTGVWALFILLVRWVIVFVWDHMFAFAGFPWIAEWDVIGALIGGFIIAWLTLNMSDRIERARKHGVMALFDR